MAIEATEANFDTEVLASERPVLVDFWAAWCGPCRALGPMLERLADEADGSWTLAKVDVAANPGLASTFGIQGIPAVRGWKDGREVAQFVGALPEPQVREWLAQLGPSAADVAHEEAQRALEAGNDDLAEQLLRRVLELEPGHARARAALERLQLAQRVGALDEEEIRDRLRTDPSDVGAAIELADVLAATGDLEGAFDVLIEVVRQSGGDEREPARTHLLKLLDTLPADDPRAMKARRSLSLVLF